MMSEGCSDATQKETDSLSPEKVVTTEPRDLVMETPKSQPMSGANITFEWEEHDFGTIWDDKPVACTFPFMNHGTKTLVITRMKAGCGCTTPVADKTVLQPGEQSVIRVQFDPVGKSKKQDKKVTIFSNASLEPEKTFWIRSIVNPIVEVNPKFLQLEEMTIGVPKTEVFSFTPAAEDFLVTEIKGIGKHGQFISGEEVETPDGQPRQIRIHVSPNMPWGAFHSQVSVTGKGTMPSGEPMTHTFTVFANGRTYGKLRSSDFLVRLSTLKSGGSYHERIRIFRGDGASFEILNVTVISPTVPGINATAVQVPSTEGMAYEIVVSGTLPNKYVGQVGGELIVQTDVLGEEVLRFRITGVVPKR